MNTTYLRWGGAVAIAGVLAFFFIPFLYNATLFACPSPAYMCPSNPSGLESLGFWLFNWGSTYSYNSASLSYIGFGNLSLFGILFTYIFPADVACVGLLAPEIVGLSRLTRAGFVGFGAFVALFSVLNVFPLTIPFTQLGIILVPTGAYMVVFGLWPWILLGDEQAQGQELPGV